jgi:hypothetical protein
MLEEKGGENMKKVILILVLLLGLGVTSCVQGNWVPEPLIEEGLGRPRSWVLAYTGNPRSSDVIDGKIVDTLVTQTISGTNITYKFFYDRNNTLERVEKVQD